MKLTVQIRNQRGLLQRKYEVLSHGTDATGAYVIVDLSSIDGVVMPYKTRDFVGVLATNENAPNTATTVPASVETPIASIDVAKTQETPNTGDFEALAKTVNEAALQLDALVTYTVNEQSALVNECAFYLDLTWTLTERLGKARKDRDNWKTVAYNTVKHAAVIEAERNDFRAKLTGADETIIRQAAEIDALREQLRQAQADAELSEARLSDMRAALEASPRKAA